MKSNDEVLPLVKGGPSSHANTVGSNGQGYGTNLALSSSSHHSQKSKGSCRGSSSRPKLEKQTSLQESFRDFSRKVSVLIASHTGSIGYLGSMSIAVNSLTGPAMLNLPATFERSGIIPTTCTLVLVCILSALCCMHMANTISKVPGNEKFKREVEFSSAFQEFWGPRWFIITQILFFCCITCLNISSIVDTSQVVDTFFGHWSPFGAVAYRILQRPDGYALDFVQWDYSDCSTMDVKEGTCIPFHTVNNTLEENEALLLSIGDLVTTLIFLPLALMDLKENSVAQIVGFVVLILTSVQFVVQFLLSDSLSFENASWWGTSWEDLFGVVLFNFALVNVIPAWLYERDPHVQVSTVVHVSSILSLLLYILIGILGDLAMPHVSENMLESMMSGSMGIAMQLGASVFAFAIIGLGIPLFSVLTRLNLTGSGLVSRGTGNVLAVFLPFSLAWFLDSGQAVTKLLSFGGLFFTGMVVFILPLLLAIHVVQTSNAKGSLDVYFGYWNDKPAHLKSLYVLLALTALSLVAAITGLIMVSQQDDDDHLLVLDMADGSSVVHVNDTKT